MSDIVVEKTSLSQVKRYPFSVVNKKKLADNTYEVSLDLKTKKMTFVPGQYVHVVLSKLQFDDPRGNSRDFSIASSPKDDFLTIAFRETSSGFKHTVLEGKNVTGEISGPFGDFTLPKIFTQSVVFIAGGIGITPFMSMLRYVNREKLAYKITLLYINSNKNRASYLDELQALQKENSNFSINTYFKRLTAIDIQKNIPALNEPEYYIAGPSQMVINAQEMLIQLGITQQKIHVEEFSGYLNKEDDIIYVSEDSPLSKGNPQAQNTITVNAKEEAGNIGRGMKEELARRSFADLEVLLQTVSNAALISETNAQGTITFANDKFVEISKYTREELIGQNHRILKSGYHPQAYYVNLWQTITRGRLWRGLLKNRAKDGSFYWVDTSIAPIIGRDNKPIKYISVRIPITERQLAEEKLQEWATEQNELRKLSQKALSVSDLSSIWDEAVEILSNTMQVEYCAVYKLLSDQKNLIYEAGTGIQNAQKGKTVIPAGDIDTMGGFVVASRVPVIVKDLTTETRFAVSPLLIDSGAVSGVSVIIQGQDNPFGILEVYTAKKRTFSKENINFIHSVANLLANAARNQLDKRKDEFLGMASHEMKTPLTSIKTFVQLLQLHAKKQNDENSILFLSKINWQVDRLADLINDLLDISRINSGKIEYKDDVFALSDLVEEVVAEQQMLTKKHKITLKNSVYPKVYADKYRIGQVLTNFIGNAIKYTPEQGKIAVVIKEDENNAIVQVKDSGIGIPKEEQKHVFDRFYQGNKLKRQSFPGGLGLGLFIASNIINRHNGQIGVKSEEGKGSEFYFTLPSKKV
jgi:PAS domain S-box-containing protein